MYTEIEDIERLFRPLSEAEKERAGALIDVVELTLEQEAQKVGKNLRCMIYEEHFPEEVLVSVVVDIVARALMTSTNTEPMTQMSQSALGYSVSGTFLVPGGGLFIKKSELARLGLRRQRMGVIDLAGNNDSWNHGGACCGDGHWD